MSIVASYFKPFVSTFFAFHFSSVKDNNMVTISSRFFDIALCDVGNRLRYVTSEIVCVM